jgi:LysM repeat protein
MRKSLRGWHQEKIKGIGYLVGLLLLYAISGCNLSLEAQAQPEPDTPAFRTTPFAPVSSVSNPVAAATLSPTGTATTVAQSNSNNRSSSCSPRTDWPVYVVSSGDTLGGIAQRTGTTVSILSAANCLADANLISVGQKLHIPPNPRGIPTSYVPPAPNYVHVGGQLTVSPVIGNDSGWFILQPGSVVTITWPRAEQLGTVEVNFTLSPPGTGSTPSIIGTDINTADGVSIQWTVPPDGTQGYLEATAGTLGGRVLVDQTQIPLQILASRFPIPTSTSPATVTITYQPFEKGYMFGRRDARKVYVLYNTGFWEYFDDTWEGEPIYPSMPEDGSIPCGNSFRPYGALGKVWWTHNPILPTRLGCGTAAQTEYTSSWEERPLILPDNTSAFTHIFQWPDGRTLILDPKMLDPVSSSSAPAS